MLVRTYGSSILGIDAITITVEVNVSSGTHYHIVGLPDNAVKESLQRVEAAIKNSGFRMPRTKVVINLAPADIRKTGSGFDLPIAVGILAASNQIQAQELDKIMMMGELHLDGSIASIRGGLSMLAQAKQDQFHTVLLPSDNSQEVAMMEGIDVFRADTLSNIATFLETKEGLEKNIPSHHDTKTSRAISEYEFADVKGQQFIKRALEVVAAGGHNVLLVGPPGAGKTMLARRIPGILPSLTLEEAIETTKVHSIAGQLNNKNAAFLFERPFRSPHHTISDVALVGGGSTPLPGEISLAHNGVLFLDELPEFKRHVLEVLRQPLEERSITVSRANMSVQFPADFILVASMNPCPCGYYNHPTKECTCSTGQVHRYLQKISGPLLDRIDLHVEVTPVPIRTLINQESSPPDNSATIRERVIKARTIQENRLKQYGQLHCNAQIPPSLLSIICATNPTSLKLLRSMMERLQLSARAYDRILKVARTVADLEGAESIEAAHIAEAVQFRCLDREKWSSS